MKTIILFIGPAGVGKSTLLASFDKWLKENYFFRSFKVNLDPATRYIPYSPDFDIRDIINTWEIAKKYKLGPNGALVKSIEIMTKKMSKIVKQIANVKTDFLLIDTPGQMDVFIFKDIALKLIELLKENKGNAIVGLFIMDASIIKRPEDYAFTSILSVGLQTRLGIEVIPVINKIDLNPKLRIIGDTVRDIEQVLKKLKNSGIYGELLSEILLVLERYGKSIHVPKVSAKRLRNLEDIYRVIHEVTCSCGDLS